MELTIQRNWILPSSVIFSFILQFAAAGTHGNYGHTHYSSSGLQAGDFSKSIGYEAPDLDVVSHNGGELPVKILVHHHYHPPIHAEDVVHPTTVVEREEKIHGHGLIVSASARKIPKPQLVPIIHAEMAQSVELYPGPGSEMQIQKSEVYSVPPQLLVQTNSKLNHVPAYNAHALAQPQFFGHGQAHHTSGLGLPIVNSNYNNLLVMPKFFNFLQPGPAFQYF